MNISSNEIVETSIQGAAVDFNDFFEVF